MKEFIPNFEHIEKGKNLDQKMWHSFKSWIEEGVQKVFGTLDLFVSLLETEIKYPILQGGILPFWTPSFYICPRWMISEI